MQKKAKTLITVSVGLLFSLLAAVQILAFFGERHQTSPRSRRFFETARAGFERFGRDLRARDRGVPVIRVFQTEGPVYRPWTADELRVKQALEKRLNEGRSTHRLVYDSGKVLYGILLEETPDYIVFSQQFGESGRMSIQLPRSRVVRIEDDVREPQEVSLRDVRFHLQFPQKFFYKSSPYTIVSEESFFAVEDIVKQLQALYRQITETFAPLLPPDVRHHDIQLLILSNHREYEDYRNRYAVELEGSSGFYSHELNRMVVYHQRSADWVEAGKGQIAAIEKQHESTVQSEQARRQLSQWKTTEQRKLLAEAQKATHSTIRHEGSHHLLFTLGIQNSAQRGRAWVTEGLATYCETERVGLLNLRRRDELKASRAARRVISLNQLMSEERFKTSLEYAEAWALTYLLMQPETRQGFFNYLEWLRRNPAPAGEDPAEELCRFLPVTASELDQKRMDTIRKLTAR